MIPIDGAMDSAEFDSNTEWSEFTYYVADEIGVKRDNLRLAYKFSTKPVKEPPKHLSRAEHFRALFDEAAITLRELQKSRSKAKSKKFQVILVNLDANARKGKSRGKVGKGKKVRFLNSCTQV